MAISNDLMLSILSMDAYNRADRRDSNRIISAFKTRQLSCADARLAGLNGPPHHQKPSLNKGSPKFLSPLPQEWGEAARRRFCHLLRR
jgi:hypothetical protein